MRPAWQWFVLALLWTLVNAAKPLTVDDTAYFYYARQIASSPADPYGFSIFWYETPQPAIEVLAPPVFLYWLGAGVRLFGASAVAWKLAMLPWAWLFVASFAMLAQRFAGAAVAGWLTAFLVCSPVFLPALNLMLDVPALGLGLAALVLFLRACDRESMSAALAAGVVAGLAIQTKYTACLVPAVMLVSGVVHRRVQLAFAASVVAVAVAGLWEAGTFLTYGRSQFADVLTEHSGGFLRKLELLPALVVVMGGVGTGWLFLSASALGWRRSWLVAAMLACLLAVVTTGGLSPVIPWPVPELLQFLTGKPLIHFHPAANLFLALGVLVVAWLGAAVMRAARAGDRTTAFLLAWLAIELAGYVLINPFVASRRVMGLAVVSTLVLGRLAVQRWSAVTPGVLRPVLVYSGCLGALFVITDMRDAEADRRAAGQAAQISRSVAASSDSRRWYTGHWGFQYYAEQEGLQPVVPGTSMLNEGDVVVVPDPLVSAQWIDLPADRVTLLHTVDEWDSWPWRTVPAYYRGSVPLAVRGDMPRRRTLVYRVIQTFVPEGRRR